MTPKEKIIKYLKIKGISQDKFSRKCNVSYGFLRKGDSFKIDLIPKLQDNYPDLNLRNLIYNEGDLIVNDESNVDLFVNEEQSDYKSLDKLIDLQQKHIELHEKYAQVIEEIKELKVKK